MSHGFECSPELILTKVKGKGIAEGRRQYIYWVMCESSSKLYIRIMKILRINMHSDLTVHKMSNMYICCCVVGTDELSNDWAAWWPKLATKEQERSRSRQRRDDQLMELSIWPQETRPSTTWQRPNERAGPSAKKGKRTDDEMSRRRREPLNLTGRWSRRIVW